MSELLKNNGFEVIEINGFLRVFVEKGKTYETYKKVRNLLPKAKVKVFYGMIEVSEN